MSDFEAFLDTKAALKAKILLPDHDSWGDTEVRGKPPFPRALYEILVVSSEAD